MTDETRRRDRRRWHHDGFTVAQTTEAGEEKFVVVAPTGVALYSFADVHAAAAEAAELNAVSPATH
jgi:hypothetical protein